MRSAHERAEYRQRILGVEHRVRGGDGEIGDAPAIRHVTEIKDAAHAVAGNKNVVIVRIVVNRRARERRRSRRDVAPHSFERLVNGSA